MSQGDFSAAASAWAAAGGGSSATGNGVGPLATASGTNARAAIARAAQATGVDFSYLLAQARLESSLDPSARAGTSSAAGLYQFTQGTWAQVLQQHGDEIGLDATLPGGTIAALRDPSQRARLMALRFDPDTSARMAAELAGDNKAAISAALGRPPRPAELYLGHFLGSDGAVRFLTALNADPGQSAVSLMPKAAAANRAIFYDASGAARSVGSVMSILEQRMTAAMQDGPLPASGQGGIEGAELAASTPASASASSDTGSFTPGWAGNLGREFASAQAGANALAGNGSQSSRPAASMAETLSSAFGLADAGSDGSSTPEFVRNAYGRLRAFGL